MPVNGWEDVWQEAPCSGHPPASEDRHKTLQWLKTAHKNLFVYFRAIIADVTAAAIDCDIGICNQPFLSAFGNTEKKE